uniref:Uncharacterized protein n=1 Tax=Cucumis melo TaxID=3656 RepID=A0A9I9EFX8_CUCME
MEISSGQHSETNPSLSPSPVPSTNNIPGTVSLSKPPLPDKKRAKATKKTTSTVCDHFTKLEENSSRCTCNYYDKEYCCDTASCGTSTSWKHLKISQLCRETCAKMLIVDDLSFKFIENEGFRHFCRVAYAKFDSPSRVTIAKQFSKDNASSNNEAISYIKKRLGSWKTIILEGELLHMRCCAHIISSPLSHHKHDLNVIYGLTSFTDKFECLGCLLIKDNG